MKFTKLRSTSRSNFLVLLVAVVIGLSKTDGFCLNPSCTIPATRTRSLQTTTPSFIPKTSLFFHENKNKKNLIVLNLVTEEEVLVAVEESEKLWEKALEARKKANELSDEAEKVGEEAASSAQDATNELQQAQKSFGMDQIESAKTAMNSSIDAGSVLSDAIEATKQADELEAMADKALEKAETLLSQHLIDFPENAEE